MRRLLFCALLPALVLSARDSTVSADPALPLPRMPICGDQDGSAPLLLQCPRLTITPDVQLYRVPGSGPVALRFNFVFREALYNNELAVYPVDNSSGAIGVLNPGDPGYLAAAFQRAQVIFPSGSNANTPDTTLQLSGGDLFVCFIVQNSTLANLMANNPNNELGKNPVAFFSLDRLNPDAVDHVVGFDNAADGYSQFGFEDSTNGGDRDYDDVVFDITPPLQPLIGPITLSPSSASLKVGQTNSLTASVTDLNGQPVSGQAVTFTVTGAHARSGNGTTDATGTAGYAYTATSVGRDSIVASAMLGSQPASSNSASADWSLYQLFLPLTPR